MATVPTVLATTVPWWPGRLGAMLPVIRTPWRTLPTWPALACRSLSIWVKCSQLVAVYDGVLTLDVTAIQISTCSRKLSIKAVFMEMTTRKWYI